MSDHVLQEWRRRQYVWKCVAAVVCGSVTVLLELLDFPPLLWVVDAHALWHLSTVPLPLLWYRYVHVCDYCTVAYAEMYNVFLQFSNR